MAQIAAGPRVKILAIDDKPANLLALEAVLGEQAYDVMTALSGAAGLELLKKNPDIALVILDVQMPIMDGFEVARRIKRMAGFEEVPVIFVTAIFREDPHVRQGYDAGAVDYFSKPFDPDVLRRKVKIYASFQQKAQQLLAKQRQLDEMQDLLKVARQHAGLLETLNIGVMISDLQGNLCQTNETALKILNSVDQRKEDAYGEFLAWWGRDGETLKAQDGPLFRAVQKGETTQHEVVTIRCVDRSTKVILASASPLRGAKGEIVGAVLVIGDITAHRKGDEEIAKRILHLVAG